MKFMIAVDLEGIACVVGSPNKRLSEAPDYHFACQQATREANAAAKALFDMGATEVVVWDNHGTSLNLIYDELDERCDLVVGVGAEHRWPGLDSTFAGALLIGYHAMDNTQDGILAHTFSSISYQWMKVNNIEVGEMAIDAAMAGEKGVPVILVSSDDKGVAETNRFMPWAETVTTKRGLGRNLAIAKHPKKVVDEIYKKTQAAVKRMEEMEVFSFAHPVSMEIRYKQMESAQNSVRTKCGWTSVDPYTVKKSFMKLSDHF